MQANFYESAFADQVRHIPVAPGTSINDWLDRTGFRARIEQDPIVVSVNGVELLEADYGYQLKDGDVLSLQQYPRGGITVAGFIEFVYYAITIVSATYTLTMPEPGVPETADVKAGSATYTLSARGNRYRPERKGPVLYGRLRIVPDFDQLPFSTYDANNDQTLH